MSFKIVTMYAFISIDPKDGAEGLIARNIGGMMMPFVCADMDRVNSLRPLAHEIAEKSGIPVKLVQFDYYRTLEENV